MAGRRVLCENKILLSVLVLEKLNHHMGQGNHGNVLLSFGSLILQVMDSFGRGSGVLTTLHDPSPLPCLLYNGGVMFSPIQHIMFFASMQSSRILRKMYMP